jgi:hypothetical protein
VSARKRERTEEDEGKKEESSFVPSKQTTLICTHVIVSWFDLTELVLGKELQTNSIERICSPLKAPKSPNDPIFDG